MAVKRLVLETQDDIALPVGESIEITIKGYSPFVCRVLNIHDENEDEPTTRQMLAFMAKNDKELQDEPDLYTLEQLKDKL